MQASGANLAASADGGPVPNRNLAEVVQLYAADIATGVTLPAQQLIGFARVDLEPGESMTIELTVPLSVLA
jgi:beta-glucosidase